MNPEAQAAWQGQRDKAHSLLGALQHFQAPLLTLPLREHARREKAGRAPARQENESLVAELTDREAQNPAAPTKSIYEDLDGIRLSAPRKFQGQTKDSELEPARREPLTREGEPASTPEARRAALWVKHSSHLPALRYDWKRIAYTDGSRVEHDTPEGAKIVCTGAGLFLPAQEAAGLQSKFTINPASEGPTNTINRAELAGIWAALHKGERTIATDSACSIAQLSRALFHPMSLRTHKHTDLLMAIIDLIRESDEEITIMKIKAHNQHIGNEVADQVAKKATNPNETCDLTLPMSAEPSYVKGYWLWRSAKASEDAEMGPENPEAESDPEDDPLGHQPTAGDRAPPDGALENMQDDLLRHVHSRHRLGGCDDSMYHGFWQAVKPCTLAKESNAYMLNPSSVTQAQRRTAFIFRAGSLWNQKIAHKCGKAKNPKCPICPNQDGCSHIVSGCSHPTMKNLYSERHNRLGRIVLKAVSKGSRGGELMMADVGTAE